MGLVGEIKVATGDVAHLSGIVGSHPLASHDAEVELRMDDADGGIPLIDEEVG